MGDSKTVAILPLSQGVKKVLAETDPVYYDLLSVYRQIEPGDFVFVRADFNVPHSKEVAIISEHRIKKGTDTLRRLVNIKAKIILCVHWQEGKKCFDVKEMAQTIAKHANTKVIVAEKDCIGEERMRLQNSLKPGEILLLQNVRMYHEEEEKKCDWDFAKKLVEGCKFYINDAPGTSHREHASIMVANIFGAQHRGAGDLLKREYHLFTSIRNQILDPIYRINCEKEGKIPLLIVAGGGKLDKIKALPDAINLPGTRVIIGGRVGHAIARYKGLVDWGPMPDDPKVIKLIEKIDLSKDNVLLPIDHIDYHEKDDCGKTKSDIWDIGPKTVSLFCGEIRKAKKIFANPVMGYAEQDCCDATAKIMKAIANNKEATTIMGGGETSAFLAKYKIPEDNFCQISPSGGAGLELLAHGMLPGISILLVQN